MMKFNFFDEIGGWDEKGFLGVMKVVAENLGWGEKEGEVSLFLVDEKRMTELNEKWRGKVGVTDVLSFDWGEDGKVEGEIFICEGKARQQAKELEQDLCAEMGRLLVHGMIHLSSLDHEIREEKNDFFLREEMLLKLLSEQKLLNTICVQKGKK